MSINIAIDETLLRAAQAATKIDDPTELVRRLMEDEIRLRDAQARLIALGGTMPDLPSVPRDRSPLARP